MRFLMVDYISELESGRRICGAKSAGMSEDVFTHHFPRYPVMPGMLILESMVQLARWLVIEGSGFESTALLASVEQAKFRDYVVPGFRIDLEVALTAEAGGQRSFRGRAEAGGKQRATAAFTLDERPLRELEDPSRVREMFAILRGHGRQAASHA